MLRGADPLVRSRRDALVGFLVRILAIRTATVRAREKIGMSSELAGGSACPTVMHKDLRTSGAGASACEPIFSRALRTEGVLQFVGLGEPSWNSREANVVRLRRHTIQV
jgi:hypothetical protein